MNSRPLEHESPPITTNPGLQKCFILTIEMAQCSELLLLTTEDLGSNPVMSKF